MVKVALIKRDGNNLSLHRLVQVAYDYSDHGHAVVGRQKSFDAAATLLNARFPKMGGPNSLYGRWKECSEWLPHVQCLAGVYSKQAKSKPLLTSSPDLDELLKNCAWYLYEIGETDGCLKLLDIALDACLEKDSLLYSQLCNNAACTYFDINNAGRCWEYFSKCLEIRKGRLPSDHSDLANTYNNIGNYYILVGNLDKALKKHNKGVAMKSRNPETRPDYMALSQIGVGRVYFLKRDFKQAISRYEQARELLEQPGSTSTFLMT